MVLPFFDPKKFIALGIFNEKFDEVKAFKGGIGWDDLPYVKDDIVKFQKGCEELGVEKNAITTYENLSFEGFGELFTETAKQVKANVKKGLNTLVIIDVSSHGVIKDGLCHVMCNSDDPEKMMYNLEDGVRQL